MKIGFLPLLAFLWIAAVIWVKQDQDKGLFQLLPWNGRELDRTIMSKRMSILLWRQSIFKVELWCTISYHTVKEYFITCFGGLFSFYCWPLSLGRKATSRGRRLDVRSPHGLGNNDLTTPVILLLCWKERMLGVPGCCSLLRESWAEEAEQGAPWAVELWMHSWLFGWMLSFLRGIIFT